MLTERLEENRIYNEDCLDTLERMEDSLLDLTVTSPSFPMYQDSPHYKFDSLPIFLLAFFNETDTAFKFI